MVVKKLELRNFRNYDSLSLDFSKGVNILYGNNAQGKTNILEAIYLCSTTKSQKGSKENEMIQFLHDESHIRMMIEKDGMERKIDMHIKKNKAKGIAIDGIPIRKSSELYGIINIVSFSPEDLNMIKNGPSERRRFLDMELCQLDQIYLHHLVNYNKTINQRNNLLKQIVFNKDLLETIEIWDKQLVNYGKFIIQLRRAYIAELNIVVRKIHDKLSSNNESLELLYDPDVDENDFYSKLVQNRDRDLALKMTNSGPHRDDFIFLINKKNIRKFGSQGQQRTSALSLKLAEITLVRNKINENPVLLLDDVLSELDRGRQIQLLNNIADTQTIVTCTGLEEFIRHRVQYDKVFKVANGTVYEAT